MRPSETTVPVRVNARELRLSAWFREAGEEMVVFLHGLGSSKQNWQQAWSLPALRGKSLLAFDLMGFGHSPRPDGFDYVLEDQASVLAAVIDAYAVRRIHLVAHSMGGTIALLLPSRMLARLANLILVEPRLKKSSCGIAAEAAQVSYQDFLSDVYPRFRKRVSSDPRAAYDLDRADPEAFYNSARSLVHWTEGDEMLERFQLTPCHRVFIYGHYNQHLEELKTLDSASKIEIQNAGHFVMHDNPDAFYRQFATMLSDGS